MLKAFCLVAPSLRFSALAIEARFFWRAIVFRARTRSSVQMLRAFAFLAIEFPVENGQLFNDRWGMAESLYVEQPDGLWKTAGGGQKLSLFSLRCPLTTDPRRHVGTAY
jgi:hypothetical protein